MSDPILFAIHNGTGIIHLNRPNALNALNLEMAESLLNKLKEWQTKKTVKRVLLTGEGEALCAGGDIKSLLLSSKALNLKRTFFQKEYTLNFAISQFTKPYMSIWNGIVMGGGIGLSIYGNARLVTEKARIAMPETAIGFFPDVGGSYFLSRLNKGIGLYIGLSGHMLNASEVLYLGLATHYQNSQKINSAINEYINNGTITKVDKDFSNSPELLKHLEFIRNTFHGDLISIMNRLHNSTLLFAKKTYNHLLTRCPTSLAVTAELLKRAIKLPLKECLEMEYQLSQHIVYRNDFNIGVKTILYNKTHNPKWSPSTINDINFEDVEKLFEPHVEPLNLN